MNKKIFFSLVLLSVIVSYTSCKAGKVITEDRCVPAFTGIIIKCSADVYFTQEKNQSMKVEAEESMIQDVETKVGDDNVLIIDIKGNHFNEKGVKVYISVSTIENIQIAGSGNFYGKNKIISDNLNLKINGSGNIEIFTEAKNVKCYIAGSGELSIEGIAETNESEINGSGNISTFNLAVKKADVVVRGSGNCKVNAKEMLNAKIFGSGNVIYRGSPTINSDIKGSGTVVQEKI